MNVMYLSVDSRSHPPCLSVQFFTFCDAYWGTLKVPEKSKFD